MKLLPGNVISRLSAYLGQQAATECRQAELSFCELNSDARLLDCGCSDGEFTLKKAENIGTRKIYGIDVVEENVNKAKAKGIEVYCGDLDQRFPFEDETFDVVSASQVIEHVSNTDGFLREVLRVLKRGGYVIISTPNLASLDSIFLLLGGWQPGLANVSDEIAAGILTVWDRHISPDTGPLHRRSFTIRALRELIEYHRFKVEHELGCGFYPLPLPISKVLAFIDRRHASYIVVKARKSE
jgi:methionine biosynthesis protein MetW